MDTASPIVVLPPSATSYTTGVLVSSAAYLFELTAAHRCGVEEAPGVFASAAATTTPAAVRADIETPAAGDRIWGNRVSVAARLVAGTAARTQEVLFEYRASAASGWTAIVPSGGNHPNPAVQRPYFIHWDATGLVPGSYDLRAMAVDVSGSSDTAPDSITIAVDPVNYNVLERLVAGKVERLQTINNGAASTFLTGGGGVGDPLIAVVIPAGALNVSTAGVTIEADPAIATAPPAGFSPVGGSAARVTLSNGQGQLTGGLSAVLSISYPEGVSASGLRVYSLNELTGVWSELPITGPHFSVFSLLTGFAAPDLSAVRVYPVPYKPNGGDPDQGVPYSAGTSNSGIVFDQLPQSVSIHIYTVTGQEVASFGADSSGGKLHWDARNGAGRDVATGLYIAVIKSPGQKSITKKLLIIR